MKEISLGYNKFTGEPTHFMERLLYGITVIAAQTRYGKSVLEKMLEVNIADVRRILIIDYYGEHKNIRYPNFFSGDKYIRGVPDLFIVENLSYYIGDFNDEGDWMSLGFTEPSAGILAKIANNIESHGNNIEAFRNILSKLPIKGEELDDFREAYPDIRMDDKINSATKVSIITRFNFGVKKGLFCESSDVKEGKKLRIDDFFKLMMKHKHVLINLKLESGDGSVGRAYVGKILQSLASDKPQKLEALKLAIFFEEADVVFPSTVSDGIEKKLSSNYWINKYVLKYQKWNPELFFVVQDLANLNPDIVNNAHKLILGIIPINNFSKKYKEIIDTLEWKPMVNYREFCFVEAGRVDDYKRNIFIPHKSPCLA